MNQSTTWKVVPAEPTRSWTNAFAAHGPRIEKFDVFIRKMPFASYTRGDN